MKSEKLRSLPTGLLVGIVVFVSIGYSIVAVFVLALLLILLDADFFAQIGLEGITVLYCIAVVFLLLMAGEGLARRIAPVWPIIFGGKSQRRNPPEGTGEEKR